MPDVSEEFCCCSFTSELMVSSQYFLSCQELKRTLDTRSSASSTSSNCLASKADK